MARDLSSAALRPLQVALSDQLWGCTTLWVRVVLELELASGVIIHLFPSAGASFRLNFNPPGSRKALTNPRATALAILSYQSCSVRTLSIVISSPLHWSERRSQGPCI